MFQKFSGTENRKTVFDFQKSSVSGWQVEYEEVNPPVLDGLETDWDVDGT